MTSMIVVDGYVPVDPRESGPLDNLRDKIGNFVLDQRAFGPRKLVVAFADADGTFRGIAYTDRCESFEPSFDACLLHLGDGAAAAVVLNDARVQNGPAPPALFERFGTARALAAARGIHLVDWFDCDDDRFRSTRQSDAADHTEWWDVPGAPPQAR